MARAAQFASPDGTALHGESNELQPSHNTLARRSLSIFSRRGTETPEPKPPFIAQAAMRIPKQMSEKRKKWIRRKSAPADSRSKPKGTILNAVPPAKTIRMTPLEEEMATSPNEEILSAIGGTPTTQTRFVWPTTPSAEHMDSLWNSNAVPLAQRTMSKRRKETNARIGVWRNGVAHWDDEVVRREQASVCEVPSLHEATGFSPLRRFPTERLNNPRPAKPILSVVIPSSELLINDTTISTIVQPMPQRSLVPVAPANLVPGLALRSPRITTDESQDDIVSPLDSPSPRCSTPPPGRPSAPIWANLDGENLSGERKPRKSRSSTISSSIEQDDDSEYSRRSSATSFEVLVANILLERGPASSPVSPSYYSPCSENATTTRLDLDQPLPPSPIPPPPTRAAPAPPCSPIERMNLRQLTRKPVPCPRKTDIPSFLERKNSVHSPSRLDLVDREVAHTTPDILYVSLPTTPTFGQVEENLEAQLSTFSAQEGIYVTNGEDEAEPSTLESVGNSKAKPTEIESTVAESGSLHLHGSVHSVLHPPERAPTIPKRSRKREWRASRNAERAVQLSLRSARRRKSESHLGRLAMEPGNFPALRKSPSATELSLVSDIAQLVRTPIESLLPPTPRIVIDNGLVVLNGPVKVQSSRNAEAWVSSASAEDVLLHILASLDNKKDLYNTTLINKGMYRVFKENEMDLIRTVAYNQSPPAWEFREWCVPCDGEQTETNMSSAPVQYAPESYMGACRRDMKVIESLKKLILERCQTFIRSETAFALSTPTHPNAQRFNDAFWRIWSFCRIFGCGKGREEDITGQLDWLKGGLLAHNQDLTATMNVNLDFDMGSVLLNPPEYFAKGNDGGLSAQQLYDMTEIWTCMTTLLEGFLGRTEQAWDNGIFDCGIGPGDDETEEQMLEEWTAYLLTLGPQVVLEMAEFASNTSSAGFALAKVNGWTRWSQPECDGSRNTFLKEPLSRLYEERVAAAALKLQNPHEEEMKEMSRKRVATLAAEIKLARQSSRYKRLPYIDMSMERPMSTFSRRNSAASTNSVITLASMSSMRRQPSTTSKRHTSPVSPVKYSRAPNFSVPRPRSPPSALWSPRKISPIIEDRVETFNRMSLQNSGSGVANDTAERAVTHIVDMGFCASQAREALRMTDLGDGLRVDRAVDMLLRGRG